MFKNTKTDYILLICILALHGAVNFVWLAQDTSPPAWDPSGHLAQSLDYFDILTTGKLGNVFLESNRYPPLVYITTTPFYLMFGKSEDVACLSLMPYLAILIFSTYFLGRRMFNRTTGLLSAFLVSTYPVIFGLTRQYFLDLPLTSMAALGVLVLLQSKNLKSPKDFLSIGLIISLGTLTKIQYIVFLAGPLMVLFIDRLIKEKKKENNILKASVEISLGIVGLALILSVWLIPNIGYNSQVISLSLYLLSGDWLQHIFSEAILHYFFALIYQVSFPLFLFFAAGLCFIARSENKTFSGVLLSWIILPYLFFTIAMLDYRYTMPFLPAVALLSAYWITDIKKETRKKALILLLFFISVAQFLLLSFESDAVVYKSVVMIAAPVSSQDVSSAPLAGNGWIIQNGSYYTGKAGYDVYFAGCANPLAVTYPPRKEDWKAEEILDLVNRTKREDNATVGMIPNHLGFNAPGFRFYSKLRDMPLVIRWVSCPADPMDLVKADYILTKTSYNGFHNGECSPQYAEECRLSLTREIMGMELFQQRFKKIGEYILPDGSSAQVYEKKQLF